MSRIKKTVLTCIGIAMALIAILMVWHSLLRPTKILVVNPLPAQKAEIILNNDSRLISVTCTTMEEARDFSKYDAVLMYGRGLYLDSIQMADLEKAAHNGVPVFTNSLRNFNFVVNHSPARDDRIIRMVYLREDHSLGLRVGVELKDDARIGEDCGSWVGMGLRNKSAMWQTVWNRDCGLRQN